jgi:hypothetical protein
MHQDSRGASAIATSGGALGVFGSGIIKSSLVLEFDTYKSGEAYLNNKSSQHLVLWTSGSASEKRQVPRTIRNTLVGSGVWLEYDGTRHNSECLPFLWCDEQT